MALHMLFLGMVSLAQAGKVEIAMGHYTGWPGYVRSLSYWDTIPTWPDAGWEFLLAFWAETSEEAAPVCFWVCQGAVPAFRDFFTTSKSDVLSDESCDASMVDGSKRVHQFCVGNSSATAPGPNTRKRLRFVLAGFTDYLASDTPRFQLPIPESLLAVGASSPLSLRPLVDGWGHKKYGDLNANVWKIDAEFWAELAADDVVCPGAGMVFDGAMERCRHDRDQDVLVRRAAWSSNWAGLQFFTNITIFGESSLPWFAGFRARSPAGAQDGDACYCVGQSAENKTVEVNIGASCPGNGIAFCASARVRDKGHYKFAVVELVDGPFRYHDMILSPDLHVGQKLQRFGQGWEVVQAFWAELIGPQPKCLKPGSMFSEQLKRCADADEIAFPVGYYARTEYRMFLFPQETFSWPNSGWEYLSGLVGKAEGTHSLHDLCFQICLKKAPFWRHRLAVTQAEMVSWGCDLGSSLPSLCVARTQVDPTYVRFALGTFAHPDHGVDFDFLWQTDSVSVGDRMADPPALVLKADDPVTLDPDANRFNITYTFWAQPMPGLYLDAWGGFYKVPGMSEPERCPKGTYRAISDYNVTGCHKCPDLASTATEANLLDSNCVCQAGYEMAGDLAAVGGDFTDLVNARCVMCGAGRHGPENTNQCRDCSPGTHSSMNGSSVCLACAAGSFANASRMTECLSCPAGSYAPTAQLSQCFPCTAGLFQDQMSSTACLWCERGKYQTEDGATTCKECTSPSGSSTKEVGSLSSSSCACGVNHYFVSETNSCEPCGAGVTCDAFGQQPLVQAGYYMKPDARRDVPLLDVYKCSSAFGQCPGQGSPSAAMCSDNVQNTSINCGLCESGYYMEEGKCTECGSSPAALVIVPMLAVFFLMGMFCVMVNQGSSVADSTEAVLTSISYGTTLAFIQGLGLFSRFQFEWPSAFKVMLDYCSLLIFNLDVFQMNCWLPQTLAGEYLQKLAFPLFMVVCCLAWGLIFRLIRNYCAIIKSNVADALTNTIGTLANIFYVSLAASVLSILECVDGPNKKSTLRAYPYAECSAEQHLTMIPVFVLGLSIYIVGVVAVFLYITLKAPMKYGDEGFQVRSKFLVSKYRPRAWWYGLVMLGRSFCLALVTIVAPSDGFQQFLLTVLILVASLGIHISVSPFIEQLSNRLETLELGSLNAVMILGSFFMFPGTRNTGEAEVLSNILVVISSSSLVALLAAVLLGHYYILRPSRAKMVHARTVDDHVLMMEGLAKSLAGSSTKQLTELVDKAGFMDLLYVRELTAFVGLEAHALQRPWFWDRRLSSSVSSISTGSLKCISERSIELAAESRTAEQTAEEKCVQFVEI